MTNAKIAEAEHTVAAEQDANYTKYIIYIR